MRQRILWMIDGLGHGGAERMTATLLPRLQNDRFGFRVCALQVKQGNPVAAELERAGIPVDLLPIPNLRHPANLPRVLGYLRREQPALIHTQLEFANILGGLAGRLLGIPVVNTLHTHESPEAGTARWRNWLSTFALNYCSRRVIAVSEDTRQFHIQRNGIRPSQICTIYNGLDLRRFGSAAADRSRVTRSTLGLTENSVVFTTVAVLREPKGIQHMLAALPAILRQVPEFRYLIVGSGDHRSTLEELANSLGVAEQVIFAGQRSDIPALLALSDGFVLPSLTEALPTVLIEAMAARLPIVATRVGGVPEMVQDQLTGRLVEPGQPAALVEPCVALACDPDLRRRMAASGYQLAFERFDIQHQQERLLALYTQLIDGIGVP